MTYQDIYDVAPCFIRNVKTGQVLFCDRLTLWDKTFKRNVDILELYTPNSALSSWQRYLGKACEGIELTDPLELNYKKWTHRAWPLLEKTRP